MPCLTGTSIPALIYLRTNPTYSAPSPFLVLRIGSLTPLIRMLGLSSGFVLPLSPLEPQIRIKTVLFWSTCGPLGDSVDILYRCLHPNQSHTTCLCVFHVGLEADF